MKMLMLASVALVSFSIPSMAQDHSVHMNHSAPTPTAVTAMAPEKGATAEFMAAHEKMMKDMDVKPTGDADKDFIAMMLPHHQGAVDMAEVELKFGKDPELLKLAQEILNAQDREIKFMKAWQEKNGK